MLGRDEKGMQNFIQKKTSKKQTNHLRNADVGGRIILKVS
jgi:hypothetical protein